MKQPYIMVAPTGARRSKSDHPKLPITIKDITDTAEACFSCGAHALHLHVRDAEGGHSLDAGLYHEALGEMRRRLPDMAVQITTESAGIFEVADQLACLQRVKPPWASVAIREVARAPDLAKHLYQSCLDNETAVQHILYEADDVALLDDWQAKGIIDISQNSVIFVLGRYTTGQISQIEDLTPFLNAMQKSHHKIKRWMICAFGPNEHLCLAEAAAKGGDVRVGFENSLLAPDGTMHEDNAASLQLLRARLSGR